jgi:hypothetical protein
MKTYGLYLPIIVVITLTALWLMRGHHEINALQASIVQRRAELAPQQKPAVRATAATPNEAKTLQANNATLLAELSRIEQATAAMQKETAALETRIPPSLDKEVTESFGRIADMGAELGQFCRLITGGEEEMRRELSRRGLSPDTDLGESVVNGFAKLVAWAPEVGAMEDTPTEIAALQSAALRDVFSLNPAQTQQTESIIGAHFVAMKAAGLTFSGREAPDWQQRRSASLTQLLWKLRPFIPANSKHTVALTEIINFGAGIETKTMPQEPGSSATMVVEDFPRWPAIPWLPAKPGK